MLDDDSTRLQAKDRVKNTGADPLKNDATIHNQQNSTYRKVDPSITEDYIINLVVSFDGSWTTRRHKFAHGNVIDTMTGLCRYFPHGTVLSLPVTSDMVKSAPRKDPVLSQVYDATIQGWPKTAPEGLVTFQNRRNDLSVHHGCAIWGVRVVVPQTLRPQLLEELHTGHLEVVKIKVLATVTYGGQDPTITVSVSKNP